MSFAKCPRILSFLSYKDQDGVRRRLKPQDINLLRILIENGSCCISTKTLAREANMSACSVSKSKNILASTMCETNQPLIKIKRRGSRFCDIIELNISHPEFEAYSERLFGKKGKERIQKDWLNQFDSKGVCKGGY